jgi:hypothetical protein
MQGLAKVFIATPTLESVHQRYVTSLLGITEALRNAGIDWQIQFYSCSFISRSRNVLAQMFLNTDCTHLLFIDADISLDNPSRRLLRLFA